MIINENSNKRLLRNYYRSLCLLKFQQEKTKYRAREKDFLLHLKQLLLKLNLDTPVGIYHPMQAEPNILPIISIFPQIQFALPNIVNKKIVYNHYFEGCTLIKSQYEIFVPKNNLFLEPSIIIIPGLAFDLQGYRLGYGKGYFDRYIFDKNKSSSDIENTQHIKKLTIIGICWDFQVLTTINHEAHDQKIDYLITNKMLIKI